MSTTSAPAHLTYRFAALTDTGRVREGNEDSVLVDEAARLVVLADGMGGYQAGEVASSMATALIAAELGSWLRGRGQSAPSADVERAMRASVDHGNRAIYDAALGNASYRGMGTTLVVGVFLGGQLLLGHAGDSRAYRWRQGRLERLTRDHSLLQAQLDAGLITPQQAANSSLRSVITRALGVEPVVALDVQTVDVVPGDDYLLCSDGLTDMLEDPDIEALLAAPGTLAERARALVDEANARGGRDNVSVILIQTAPAT